MPAPSSHPIPAFDTDEVYPPAEDTFLLLAAAKAEARPQYSVLEIGCGSGLLSRELAPLVRRLVATDINPHAARAARPGELRPSGLICSGASKEAST